MDKLQRKLHELVAEGRLEDAPGVYSDDLDGEAVPSYDVFAIRKALPAIILVDFYGEGASEHCIIETIDGQTRMELDGAPETTDDLIELLTEHFDTL